MCLTFYLPMALNVIPNSTKNRSLEEIGTIFETASMIAKLVKFQSKMIFFFLY